MIDPTNGFLQDQVEYQAQATRGAVAQDLRTLAFDFDSTVTSVEKFTYGEIFRMGPNEGAAKLDALTTPADILGVVPMYNAGVIDFAGYSKPMYSNIAGMREGVMYLKTAPGENILLNGDVFLMVDPESGDEELLGLLFATQQAGTIDVSQLFKPVKNTLQVEELVLCEIRIGSFVDVPDESAS